MKSYSADETPAVLGGHVSFFHILQLDAVDAGRPRFAQLQRVADEPGVVRKPCRLPHQLSLSEITVQVRLSFGICNCHYICILARGGFRVPH